MEVDSRLVDVFCDQLGEDCRDSIVITATMDDIEAWDSLAFINLVMAIEEKFGVKFSMGESAQMYSVANIMRLLEEKDVLGG